MNRFRALAQTSQFAASAGVIYWWPTRHAHQLHLRWPACLGGGSNEPEGGIKTMAAKTETDFFPRSRAFRNGRVYKFCLPPVAIYATGARSLAFNWAPSKVLFYLEREHEPRATRLKAPARATSARHCAAHEQRARPSDTRAFLARPPQLNPNRARFA